MIITVQLAGGSKSKYLMINCCPTAVARWRLVAIYAGSRSFCWLLYTLPSPYYTYPLKQTSICMRADECMFEVFMTVYSWTKRANVFFLADVTVTFHAVHYCDNIRMLYKQNNCYFEKKGWNEGPKLEKWKSRINHASNVERNINTLGDVGADINLFSFCVRVVSSDGLQLRLFVLYSCSKKEQRNYIFLFDLPYPAVYFVERGKNSDLIA